MKTNTTKALRYGWLVVKVLFWVSFEKAACLVSAEARQLVAEAKASQAGCIDPLTPILDELDELHIEFFGS
jgi:hypothetical protein